MMSPGEQITQRVSFNTCDLPPFYQVKDGGSRQTLWTCRLQGLCVQPCCVTLRTTSTRILSARFSSRWWQPLSSATSFRTHSCRWSSRNCKMHVASC